MLYTLLGVLAACIALASVAAWLGIAQLMRGFGQHARRHAQRGQRQRRPDPAPAGEGQR